MLILTRKENEKILIDDQIEISVIKIKGNRVKIGIEAPEDVEILRDELYKSVVNENIAATNSKNLGIDKLKKYKREKDDNNRKQE